MEITAEDVKHRLDAGETLALIDVREPFEHRAAHIEGAELIPMNSIPEHLPELRTKSAEAPLIVICHHGVRSLNVVSWLRRQGVANCWSMEGGIDQWSLTIDPAVPRY
jgi:rhodanese-related sulfurtransferase